MGAHSLYHKRKPAAAIRQMYAIVCGPAARCCARRGTNLQNCGCNHWSINAKILPSEKVAALAAGGGPLIGNVTGPLSAAAGDSDRVRRCGPAYPATARHAIMFAAYSLPPEIAQANKDARTRLCGTRRHACEALSPCLRAFPASYRRYCSPADDAHRSTSHSSSSSGHLPRHRRAGATHLLPVGIDVYRREHRCTSLVR